MFPPLTLSGCLLIWVLKPVKLPSPKPDILQFLSLLLLDSQLFPPTQPVPLMTFPIIQYTTAPVTVFYKIEISLQILAFHLFSHTRWCWCVTIPLTIKCIHPSMHTLLLPCFNAHTPAAFLYGELSQTHTFIHSKPFPQVSTACDQTAQTAFCSLCVCTISIDGVTAIVVNFCSRKHWGFRLVSFIRLWKKLFPH